MPTVLTVIFILSLGGIVLHAIIDAQRERRTVGSGSFGSPAEWAEAARTLDLEVVPRTSSTGPSLRGSISGHWVSVEQVEDGIEIMAHYLSGGEPFQVVALPSILAEAANRIETGDDAFDSELAILGDYPDDLTDYLSPARRNALLWLRSSFEITTINDEDISVRFTNENWKAEDLTAAITLLVDVADIMQTGQKVFMAPPTHAPNETELEPELEVIDGGLAS